MLTMYGLIGPGYRLCISTGRFGAQPVERGGSIGRRCASGWEQPLGRKVDVEPWDFAEEICSRSLLVPPQPL